MKLNNTKKIQIIIGSMLVLPGMAMAVPPVNFDQWSATSGVIDTSAACAGITCTPIASDPGMLQEKLIDADGYEYIHLIITDKNADGAPGAQDFTSENFVPFSFNGVGNAQGLAAKQVVRDTAEGLTSTAEIQRAMMRLADPGGQTLDTNAADMWSVRLTQVFNKPELQSSFQYTGYTAFLTGFNFGVGMPDSDTVIGHITSISQSLPIVNGATDVDPNAQQQFVMSEAGGIKGNCDSFFCMTDPGTFFAGAPITTAGSMTLDGTAVPWADENIIGTTWVAQTNMFDATYASVAAQTFTNFTSGSSASATATNLPTPLTPLGTTPFDWDETNLGTAPSFP
jgi:hypothetical protein